MVFAFFILLHGLSLCSSWIQGVLWHDRPAGLWQPWLAVLVDVINVELPYVKRV